MNKRIVILGAGFGGLELTTRLSDEFGAQVDIVLIDKAHDFVFGFSKLDVMFGRTSADHVRHAYSDIVKPGVRFVPATVTSIDPVNKVVTTDAGMYEADILVVALGADVVPAATPGLLEGGYEFYTNAGAFALREVLADFDGGRVVVGVTSTPFKCPPAPSETALLLHDLLEGRGVRTESEISLVMPLGAPIPPSPQASAALLTAFQNRGINWISETRITELDVQRQVALGSNGFEIGYDLFLGVPKHQAPRVVLDSPLAFEGWIPVDPATLETRFNGVYAVGDVTNVGTPKAGVFSEGQAVIVASQIISKLRDDQTADEYDGHGICYLEFGHDSVAKVDVTFTSGQRPTGDLQGPSPELAVDKTTFGETRIKKWFGRDRTSSAE